MACHGTGDDFSVKYEFTGMSVENAQNLGELPEPTSLDSIPAVAYVIRVNLFSDILAEGSAAADTDHPPENFNHVDSIEVTSSSNFGIGFPSGSSLNDNFIQFNSSYFHTFSLDQLRITNYWNEDYKSNPVPSKIELMLLTPPALPSTHVFTVKLYLEDGSVHIDSTAQILLY